MLKIILISLLLLNSIFWGLYPISDNSPYNYIINLFNYDYKVNKFHHITIGTLFFFITVIIAHSYN